MGTSSVTVCSPEWNKMFPLRPWKSEESWALLDSVWKLTERVTSTGLSSENTRVATPSPSLTVTWSTVRVA